MVFPTHIPLQKCSWGLQLTPELLLVAEVFAAEDVIPLPEALLPEVTELADGPEAPPVPVVTPELAALFVLVGLPLPPAPPTPAADSSITDPFAQAEAVTTHAKAIKNPVVHHARPFVLRRLMAMLMSP